MSSEPQLEMLWEASDPQDTLKKLGFPDAGSVADWVAAAVDTGWGVDVKGCQRIVFSAGNALAWIDTDRGSLIAKASVYEVFHPHLEETSRLAAWLGESGFPVAAPIPLKTGGFRLRSGGASIELQPVMDGELLDAEDPGQAHMAGATLARLHGLLAEYPGEIEGPPLRPTQPGAALGARIETWMDSEADALASDLTDLMARLAAAAPAESPPIQLVHLDYRSANLLCRESVMTAVLDFEEAGPDHCVVDLAKASVLLGTKFTNWAPTSGAARASFLKGYQSVRTLSAVETGWLDVLTLWWTLQAVAGGWWDREGWLASARELAATHG